MSEGVGVLAEEASLREEERGVDDDRQQRNDDAHHHSGNDEAGGGNFGFYVEWLHVSFCSSGWILARRSLWNLNWFHNDQWPVL